MNTYIYKRYPQKGTALVVGLIFLSVITVLSLSAMRNTNLDTRIAANHQHKQITFQAAENALARLTGPNPTINLPGTPEDDPVMNKNYFVAKDIDYQPDTEADVLIDFVRTSNRGEYKFSGFGLDVTTLIYQADATGKITGTSAKAHNRMGIVLVRN